MDHKTGGPRTSTKGNEGNSEKNRPLRIGLPLTSVRCKLLVYMNSELKKSAAKPPQKNLKSNKTKKSLAKQTPLLGWTRESLWDSNSEFPKGVRSPRRERRAPV
jgi:hypothetical protein